MLRNFLSQKNLIDALHAHFGTSSFVIVFFGVQSEVFSVLCYSFYLIELSPMNNKFVLKVKAWVKGSPHPSWNSHLGKDHLLGSSVQFPKFLKKKKHTKSRITHFFGEKYLQKLEKKMFTYSFHLLHELKMLIVQYSSLSFAFLEKMFTNVFQQAFFPSP